MSSQQNYHGQTATLVPATLRGYRSWTSYRDSEDPSRFKLIGQYSHHWRPNKTMVAICGVKKEHEAPGDNCTCGIYAKYTPVTSSWGRVPGIVEASGKIILGTKGFKSAEARIVALYYNLDNFGTSSLNAIIEIAEQFGVPYFKSEWEALEAFPIQDLSALGIEIDTSDERDVALKVLAARILELENNNIYQEYSQNSTGRTRSSDMMQRYAKFEYDSGKPIPCTCISCNNDLATKIERTRALTRDEEWRLRQLQKAVKNPYGNMYRTVPAVWATYATTLTEPTIDYEVVSCKQIIREEQDLLRGTPISRFQIAVAELLNEYYKSLEVQKEIDYTMIEAQLALKLQAPISLISSVGGA